MYAVIMAGGAGTRFWPLSRAARPKQFLDIVGGVPLVFATFERVRSLCPEDHVVLVVGREHKAETERIFAGTAVHVLGEPVGRNTAPCIGLAARCIERLGGGGEPVAILPADHYIARPDAFREGLVKAVERAAGGALVTLGIVPTRPETGYGYIERGAPLEDDPGVFRVASFVEKPSLAAATEYIHRGTFSWNAGIFVATPETLLSEFSAHMPDFARGLEEVGAAMGTPAFDAALSDLYARTSPVSFDYAVMEKTTRPVCVVPVECGWSDVGSWYSLYEVRRAEGADERGNVVEGDASALQCRDCFVMARGGRHVVTLGARRLLVVDTEDALLVADLERSQDVRHIPGSLADNGRKHLT